MEGLVPTEPILVQVDDDEHVATADDVTRITTIRQDPGPASGE